MLKKIPIATMLFLLITSPSMAQSDSFSGSLLWEISGNGLKESSYIMGTHHLAPTEFTDTIKGFKIAMDASKQIYGEIEIASSQNIDILTSSDAYMPHEMSYADLYTEEEYNVVDEMLTSLIDFGLEYMGKFKPVILSTMSTSAMYIKSFPEIENRDALDIHIQKIALQRGKKCYGLETAQDQLDALLKTESIERQAARLLCFAENLDKATSSIDELNELYFSGDLDGMYKMAFEESDNPCSLSEEYSMALNKERNNKWLEKLPSIFAESSTFVAVGALHLAGEDGLLYQLSKMGYRVTPMR